MTVDPLAPVRAIRAVDAPGAPAMGATPLVILDDGEPMAGDPAAEVDPAALILTCLNCGARMDERKCKLICRCGYFLSCSDYY